VMSKEMKAESRRRLPARAPRVGFLGIGAQKCATSWLHHVLSQHPQVRASDPKELNYFTANYDRGALWYESHFAGAGEAVICGEASPTYFFSADAPERAHRYNPALKLIAVVRDPVARAFSNHLHEIRKGHIPEDTSFETALAANPAYVLQGRYRENLTRWIDRFGREALLVLVAEELSADPAAGYAAVCAHLGVSAEAPPDDLNERKHESVSSHFPALQRGLRAGGDAARRLGLGGMVRSVKSAPGIRGALGLNRKDLRKTVAPMADETHAMLIEQFADDVAFVRGLLGRPLPEWRHWPPREEEDRQGMRHAV
jgi:hypothetical protein